MNKGNSIINEFLLSGDKFMPELHLVDPIVKKYSACVPFKNTHTKNSRVFKYRQVKLYLQRILIKLVFNMI